MRNKLFKVSAAAILFFALNIESNKSYAGDIYIPFKKDVEDNTDKINFVDLNLKQSLLSYYKFHIDKNYSGSEITKKMMEEFTSLSLPWANIFSIEELKYAKNLKSLDLSNNFIEDISSLSYLENLKDLNLNNNKIKEADSLKNILSLKKLAIKKNLIEDISFINKLNLEELDLSKNGILKNKIKDINSINTLRVLNIKGIGLENIDFISNFKNLEVLYASENNLKNLNGLENLSYLSVLHIDKNSIDDISSLEKLNNLTEVVASKNNIINIESLKDKTKLHRLMLDDNLELNNIYTIRSIVNLASISLDNTKVTSLEPLDNLKYLFYVSIVGTKINVEDVNKLKSNNESYKNSSNIDKKLEIVELNSSKYFSLKNYIFMFIITLISISGIYSYWKKNK